MGRSLSSSESLIFETLVAAPMSLLSCQFLSAAPFNEGRPEMAWKAAAPSNEGQS